MGSQINQVQALESLGSYRQSGQILDDVEAHLNQISDTVVKVKGYLKLGGMVGQGVYVDRAFNTTDICMVLDTQQLTTHAGLYTQ